MAPADFSSYNQLFAKDRKSANNLGVSRVPAVAINSQLYAGELTADAIFSTVCQSYKVK